MANLISLLLFIIRLPYVMAKVVYTSGAFVLLTLPNRGVKYVYNSVGRSKKSLSKWYFGEKINEDEQTIITTRLSETPSRPSSPKPPLRRFSSSAVDFSIPLYRMSDRIPLRAPAKKDSLPDLTAHRLYSEPSPLLKAHSRSYDNILQTLDEVNPKPLDKEEIRKRNVDIFITEPSMDTTDSSSPLLTPSTQERFSSPLGDQSMTPIFPPDTSEDRSTQVFEFKSEFWYTCLFVCNTRKLSENVSLVGDFNGWDTNAHKMYPCQEGYARCVDLLEGRYEYKFQIDGDFVSDTQNHFISSSFKNSIIFVHTDPAKDHPPRHLTEPHLEHTRENASFYYFQIHTPVLKDSFKRFGVLERPIYVYLPPSYSDESKSYPVVYCMDGQSVFSSGVHGWHLDGLLDDMWLQGKLKEFILVAVPNGDDIQPGHRVQEYCPRDFRQSSPFLEFMVQSVKPYTDSNFRTLPDAANSFVLGSSLGGLFAFYLTAHRPELFSVAICVAPAFWFHDVNDRSVFDLMEATRNVAPKCRVYIDSGTGEEDNFYVTRSMAETLGDLDWIPGKDFLYRVDYSPPIECEGHFTTHHHKLWRERIPDALKFVLDPTFD